MASLPSPRWPLLPIPWALLALPAATYAVGASFAAAESDPLAAAESRFLALVIAAGVAIMAWLRADRPVIAATGSMLGVTALLASGVGATRGAVCMAAVTAGIALAAAGLERQARAQRQARAHGHEPGLRFWIGTALGIQLLCQPKLLLLPHTDLARLLALLGPPLLVAASAWSIAGRLGVGRVLIAGGTAALLGPGWTWTIAFAWMALAGAAWWPCPARAGRTRALALTVGATVALGVAGTPVTGVTVLLAAVLLADDRRVTRIAVAAAAIIATVAATFFDLGIAVPAGQLVAIGLGVIALVPAALRIRPRDADRVAALLTLLVLAARADHPQAIGVVLAVIALGLDPSTVTLRLQAWWTAAALGLASLLAAYPWVRANPRDDALAMLGLGQPRNVLLGAVLLLGLGALLDQEPRQAARRRWASAIAVLAVFATLLLHAGTAPVATFTPAVALGSERGGWRHSLGGTRRVRGVVVESSLTNSLALAPNALLATVTVRDADGETLAEWQLRSGRHTAEWASERADVAARLGGSKPAPHAAGVAADGTFFARRYRSRFALERPVDGAAQVAIRRIQRLPETVQLVLHRVEVVP